MSTNFKIHNAKKLRSTHPLFVAICTLEEIRKWPVDKLNLQYSESITLVANNIEIHEEKDQYHLEIDKAVLLTYLPNEKDTNEFPVIIQKNSTTEVILKTLLSDTYFSKLIEISSKKVSKNSTKIMSLSLLRKILKSIFSEVPLSESNNLANDLINYIHQLMEIHAYLKPLSVKEKQAILETSVKISSNAWFVYLYYFLKEWNNNKGEIKLPQLDKEITYEGWIGHFFDRSNPLWTHIHPKPHYPSNNIQIKIYRCWEGLVLKELP